MAEYSDKEDDEALKAPSMAADLGKKLDEVLKRVTKLDVIENRFNNLYTTMANIKGAISSLDKDVAELKAKSKTTIDSVNKLEQSVDFNASDIANLKRDLLRTSNLRTKTSRKSSCILTPTAEEKT